MSVVQGPGANPTGAAPHIPTISLEILSELSRATTAYYEATPDRLEQARQEYEEALRRFNATSEGPQL
jgi:hypothetical protein